MARRDRTEFLVRSNRYEIQKVAAKELGFKSSIPPQAVWLADDAIKDYLSVKRQDEFTLRRGSDLIDGVTPHIQRLAKLQPYRREDAYLDDESSGARLGTMSAWYERDADTMEAGEGESQDEARFVRPGQIGINGFLVYRGCADNSIASFDSEDNVYVIAVPSQIDAEEAEPALERPLIQNAATYQLYSGKDAELDRGPKEILDTFVDLKRKSGASFDPINMAVYAIGEDISPLVLNEMVDAMEDVGLVAKLNGEMSVITALDTARDFLAHQTETDYTG